MRARQKAEGTSAPSQQHTLPTTVDGPPKLLYRAFCSFETDWFAAAFNLAAKTREMPLMPVSTNVVLGKGVKIFQPDLVNLYG